MATQQLQRGKRALLDLARGNGVSLENGEPLLAGESPAGPLRPLLDAAGFSGVELTWIHRLGAPERSPSEVGVGKLPLAPQSPS